MLQLQHPTKKAFGRITLTGSKSESNRALILQALSKGKVKVENLSEAADTVTLHRILNTPSNPQLLDVGPAGTAMRFLTAFLALQNGVFTLTGSQRMKERPIGILADALKALGADISYLENEGFPPLQIHGPLAQKTNRISIKGNVSSQYISALLLIAPALPLGLTLEIDGELTSKPYVKMTLAMLAQAGIQHDWKGNSIEIRPQSFLETTLVVAPDWSAASYWYSIAALADYPEFFLPNMKADSLQGDQAIIGLMAHFGIISEFIDGGLQLKKTDKIWGNKMFDFRECPDLAQTFIVCCAAKGYEASFTGLETLRIKETDRIGALQAELAKIGVRLIEENQVYRLDCATRVLPEKISIKTYDDHRMAMAFTPLALVINEVEIQEPDVVNKSYPDFWKHLQTAGFEIKN